MGSDGYIEKKLQIEKKVSKFESIIITDAITLFNNHITVH